MKPLISISYGIIFTVQFLSCNSNFFPFLIGNMNWSRSRSQNKEDQMEPEPKIGKLNGAGAENRKKVESEPKLNNFGFAKLPDRSEHLESTVYNIVL